MITINQESLSQFSAGNDAADCAHAVWGAATAFAFMGPLGLVAATATFLIGTVACVEYHR